MAKCKTMHHVQHMKWLKIEGEKKTVKNRCSDQGVQDLHEQHGSVASAMIPRAWQSEDWSWFSNCVIPRVMIGCRSEQARPGPVRHGRRAVRARFVLG